MKQYLRQEERYEFAKDFLAKLGYPPVLDVGCGKLFFEQWKGYKGYVIGIDYYKMPNYHNACGRNYYKENRDVIRADANMLPIRSNSVLPVDFGCSKMYVDLEKENLDKIVGIGFGGGIIRECVRVAKHFYLRLSDRPEDVKKIEKKTAVKCVKRIEIFFKNRTIDIYQKKNEES